MSENIRNILLIADIHAGSPYAICDEEGIGIVFGNEVNYVKPNKGQLELYKHWMYMSKIADNFNVDTVINLGDTVDGADYRGGGQGVMTAIIDSQVDLATRLLSRLVKNRGYVSVSASPYHSSRDTKSELAVTIKLDKYAKNTLFVGAAGLLTIPEVNKKLLVAHKSSNAMLYTATMLDRELIYQKVAEANNQLPNIHYRITAHLHKAMHLDNGYQHYVQTPCWKTWYPIKNSTQLIGRRQSDIGWAIISFDEAGRSVVKLFVYPSPNIAIKEAIL